MDKYTHTLSMKVRDYECDLQGIVNNANYMHYLEHARHELLLARGLSFAQLHRDGIDAVVAAVAMRFKCPLKSGDEFMVKSWFEHQGVKYIFHQDIFRASDGRLSIRAVIDVVCVVNGQLSEVDIL